MEQSATDEPGYDDNMEYFPSNRTVRVVTVRGGDEPKAFAKWSFEEWATIEAAEVAKPRAVAVTAERLGTDEFGSSIGRPPESADTDDIVVWLYLSTQVEDGEVVSTPSMDLRELVEEAPRSVDATVSLEGDTFSRSVPVYAEHARVGLLAAEERSRR